MTDDNAMAPFTMADYQKFTPTTAIYDPRVELTYIISLIASEAGEISGKYSKYLRDNTSFNNFANDKDGGCFEIFFLNFLQKVIQSSSNNYLVITGTILDCGDFGFLWPAGFQ